MAYGTLNAGTITPGSGNTLTINETVTHTGAVTLPSPVINTGVSGTAILDEDAMGSDSATQLATQQSIKAYVDSAGTNSSITTLGTVTAGNLSNTAIVYPVGHILQEQHMFFTTSSSLGNNAYPATGISDSITGIGSANSTFLIFATVSAQTSSTNGFNFKIGRNSSGSLSAIGGMATQQSTYIGKGTTGGQSLSLIAYETPGSTNGVTFTYTVWFQRSVSGGGAITINPNSSTSSMIIMEVAG